MNPADYVVMALLVLVFVLGHACGVFSERANEKERRAAAERACPDRVEDQDDFSDLDDIL